MNTGDCKVSPRKCLSWLYPSSLFSDDVSKKSESALEKCGLLDASESSSVSVGAPVATTVTSSSPLKSGFVSNQMHQHFLNGTFEAFYFQHSLFSTNHNFWKDYAMETLNETDFRLCLLSQTLIEK